MSIHRFPLKAIQRVRQYINNALAIPEAHPSIPTNGGWNEVEDWPEPDSLDDLSDLFSFGGVEDLQAAAALLYDQWYVSTVNPGAALLKLPGLRLKPEWRLVTYLYRSQTLGAGVVWAVPADRSTTAHLERALTANRDITQAPHPDGAIAEVMEVIDGDRTPASFILASLLQRELADFGAAGDRAQWSRHRLIDVIPPQLNWEWQEGQPKDLSAKVKVLPDGQAAVEFFSCAPSPKVCIYRHVDQYTALEDYRSHRVDKIIAIARR